MLSRYKSGPLPKPFKIIPTLPAWARILALTHPENWSPQACYAATRMFVSMMKPPQARVFLEGVLLDAIREDIRLTKEGSRKTKNHRKLNVHYYESLKRALYKPAAFFKGIVFPLLQVRFSTCLARFGFVPRPESDRVHATGSCDCCFSTSESEGAPASFGRCAVEVGGDGLLRYGGRYSGTTKGLLQ